MIETKRLVLRAWEERDIAPFQAICSDPLVMAQLGPPMTLTQVATRISQMQAIQAELGHCFWAVERREDARLIGWCGVIRGSVGPVQGKSEIGWRLASDCWGRGFASEGARATIAWCFASLSDDAVWAITTSANVRSRAVMERLGMRHLPELSFDHPGLGADDPLRPHVTYSLERASWPTS